MPKVESEWLKFNLPSREPSGTVVHNNNINKRLRVGLSRPRQNRPKIAFFSTTFSNNAVYATASVANGWAGAVMRFGKLFGENFTSVTDLPSDGPTDRWTDRVTYRVACTRLKIALLSRKIYLRGRVGNHKKLTGWMSVVKS